MKQMLLCSVLWCLVEAGPVSATQFDITFTSVFVEPNNGLGDNVGFRLLGPGTEIIGGSGIPCFAVCSSFTSFGPGDEVPGFESAFSQFLFGGKLGGRFVDVFAVFGGVTLPGGTLPSAPAAGDLFFGPITFCGGGFSVGSGLDDRGNPFELTGASTGLCSTWGLGFPGFGGSQFLGAFGESGTPPAPTPEPATLVLLGSGLLAASVFGRTRLGRRKA